MKSMAVHLRLSLRATLLAMVLLQGVAAMALDSPAAAPADTCHGNIIERLIDYVGQTNSGPKARGVDWSLIGGPFYSSDTRLGVGLVAAAQYYDAPADSGRFEPSYVELKGLVSTTLFYEVGIDGMNFFPGNNMRLGYEATFFMLPTYNWGVGWERATADGTKCRYRNLELHLQAHLEHRIAGDLWGGVMAEFYHANARRIEHPEIWNSYPLRATDVGAGLTLRYDTRNCVTAPSRGYNLQVTQRFFPRFMGNGDHGYSSSELDLAAYRQVWRGGVLAARLRGIFTYGNTPWMRMPTFGGRSSLRGYYVGQYRGKRAADLTLELRQHVWKRSGIVLWAGCGEIWSRRSELRWSRLLPNGGCGYRFEFKKNVNVRVDVGFGRDTWGVEFGLNEAF